MKTTKNNFLLIGLFAVGSLFLNSCNQDDDDDGDLTTNIVGHYTNATTSTDIVVNKINESTVSIALTTGTGSGQYNVAFSSVTMNSETAFTLNSVTQDGAACIGEETFTGTGTHSENNISLFLTVVGSNPDGPTPYDCDGTNTRNVSASK